MKSLTTLLSDFRKIYSVPKPDSCGLLSYTVTHFGLQNTPPAFQYFMNEVVGHFESFAVYLGDVLVYSDTWASHTARTKALLNRLCEGCLIVNLAKCEFTQATVTYLGYQVGEGKVHPLQTKVEAISTHHQ